MIRGVRISQSELARILGGEKGRPGQVLAPGPNHSRRDRSMSVFVDCDTLRVTSHAGDDWRACEEHVRQILGLPSFDPREAITPRAQPSRAEPEVTEDETERLNRRIALRLWREAQTP